MTPREILNAIARGLERAARQAEEDNARPLQPQPARGGRGKPIGEMTAREILDAIDRGLAEAARPFAAAAADRSSVRADMPNSNTVYCHAGPVVEKHLKMPDEVTLIRDSP